MQMGFVTSDQAGALVTPVQRRINFEASCFCHGKTVDVGFVCTVCLSGSSTHVCVCVCGFVSACLCHAHSVNV